MPWTSDQILGLAPDASSAKSGRDLAQARKWLSLGQDDEAAWGTIQGSGQAPYQTSIDVGEPAFKCSCPSRKFPCKHSLGLFLLLAQQPDAFTEKTRPAWTQDWLEGRKQRAEKKTRKEEEASADPEAGAKREAQTARRAAQREDRVTAGLADMDLWLRDVVRQGLAAAQTKDYSFWEKPAARLTDAQAPGLRRMVLQLAGLASSGPGWQERLLERLGLLFLLVQGYKRLSTLTPETQADVRTWIGWTTPKEELLAHPGLRDQWCVLGQVTFDDDLDANLRVQRTWLWGRASARQALVLQFAYGQKTFDPALAPGSAVDAELVFFPSACPLRALVKTRGERTLPLPDMPGFPGIDAGLAAYGRAIASVPWLTEFPLPLRGVTPERAGETFVVHDGDGMALPLAPSFACGWELAALSGGRPIDVFGEWDGEAFRPLTAWGEGAKDPRMVVFQPRGGGSDGR